MDRIHHNAALDELRQKCQRFRAGDQSTGNFEDILTWAKAAPRRFGVVEVRAMLRPATAADRDQLKRCLSELDSDEVTNPVPGWAAIGRAALWQEQDFLRNKNVERLQAWQPPPPPVSDEFKLVRSEYSTEDNKYRHPYNTFVVCSCAVQSKLVSPIIRELDRRQGSGDFDEQLKKLLERFCLELIKVRERVLGGE
ncbi:uncharacterized protein N0V89_007623 [Didymosphaeria variabile]|uniref:Uncharacterized protein n=1 Tax=Didymosphaeria variabile TaxID=1932322 RepID=A0A9W8XKG4_9PLEO|nr:uncharacterized protein N0V89_007623 [Didymosphaeria variabile]KAJ4352276.1 hypothetical protein N0V89_007623 [Didymosphaeria variabile]